jgi:25S rRNA (cytosine2278-C5)-methyltransferase
MSFYHATAAVLAAPPAAGGNLKSRIFGSTVIKKKKAAYALAMETCKWSSVLSEVIENAKLLEREKTVRLRPFVLCPYAHKPPA